MLPKLRNKYLRKPLKLYWWRYQYPERLNFGDEITPVIIEKLWGRKCKWTPPNECDIVGAGSIIEILQRKSAGNEIKVWGSGFIQEGPSNSFENLCFTAVRGKLTLSRVSNKNIALGDPGLLLPLVIKPSSSKKYKIGIVPHYVDLEDENVARILKNTPNSLKINPLWPAQKVIESITSCESILSSSLHGLIVPDAYGIPNQRLVLSNGITGGDYKFKDYYSIFDQEPASLGPEQLQSLDVDELINQYNPKQNLDQIQNSLIGASPF